MFRVMTRSMDLYRRRNAGRVPRRVMLHKSTEFKQAEIDGAMEALQACDEIDLIQIVEDVAWQGVRFGSIKSNASQPANYPVERGTLLSLSDFECLLWLHGDSDVTPKKSYFQGGKGTPRPLKLIRHAGHGNWDDTAISALALSKMNWNNDALYDHLPVTMSYSKTLARVIKRMDGLGSTPYQFRFFM